MRYIISGRVKPGQTEALSRALEARTFGEGFPYGDLGEAVLEGRVDHDGTVRWVEVCYCREFLGVALEEELPYFEEYLTSITIADARSPRHCKGYPHCSECDCTAKLKLPGMPLGEVLASGASEPKIEATQCQATRWLGWRGEVTAEERQRNGSGS